MVDGDDAARLLRRRGERPVTDQKYCDLVPGLFEGVHSSAIPAAMSPAGTWHIGGCGSPPTAA